jgi:hypothetical protein
LEQQLLEQQLLEQHKLLALMALNVPRSDP